LKSNLFVFSNIPGADRLRSDQPQQDQFEKLRPQANYTKARRIDFK